MEGGLASPAELSSPSARFLAELGAVSSRIQNEVRHGRFLAEHGAGEIWNWEGTAGQKRWKRRVQMLCRDIGPGSVVLELGCGTGYFTRELAKTGACVTAIDISPDLIAEARRRADAENAVFRIEDAHALTFHPSRFDFVVGSSVLHHLEVLAALKECFRVLKPGGRLRFTEPNMVNPQIAIQKNVPFVKRWLGDSPDETAFFRWPLGARLEELGYQVESIRPFDFLHPKTPAQMVSWVERIGFFLEKCPVVNEIAGSLFIEARKPA